MDLLTVIIVLVVVGVLLYLINVFVPMDGKIKKILNITTVIIVILWLVKIFGLLDSVRKIHI